MLLFLIILTIYLAIGFIIAIIIVRSEINKYKNTLTLYGRIRTLYKIDFIILFLLAMFLYGWFFLKLLYNAITNGSKKSKHKKINN